MFTYINIENRLAIVDKVPRIANILIGLDNKNLNLYYYYLLKKLKLVKTTTTYNIALPIILVGSTQANSIVLPLIVTSLSPL